jgi:hypothetical protein
MADDDLIDDEDLETLDVEELDEEDLGDDAIDVVDDDEVVLDDEPDEEEEAAEATADTPKARKKVADDEDDEDELDPDDVEADLDTILKDRIAASEDEEEDEELEEQPTRVTGEAVDGVLPKKANEFTCTGCFLLVHPGQFGPPDNMECPVGESACPAIDKLKRQYARAKK